MQVYAAFNAPIADLPPGVLACTLDSGTGAINGQWVAESFKGGWNGPKTDIDPDATRKFASAIPKKQPFVSDYFEDKFDAATLKKHAIALEILSRRDALTGVFCFPTTDPAMNDRVHRQIGKYLSWMTPGWYFSEPGDVMTPREVFEAVSRLAEGQRLAVKFSKQLALVVCPYTHDGRVVGGKNDQLIELAGVFGADLIVWASGPDAVVSAFVAGVRK